MALNGIIKVCKHRNQETSAGLGPVYKYKNNLQNKTKQNKKTDPNWSSQVHSKC